LGIKREKRGYTYWNYPGGKKTVAYFPLLINEVIIFFREKTINR
jgi:hypothetical protein